MGSRYLADVHVHYAACQQLGDRGLDIVHAGDVGHGETDDLDLLIFAAGEERILLTRNYRHFDPIVRSWSSRGRQYPGVLFIAPSIPQGDARLLIRSLESWDEEHGGARTPVTNGAGWLGSP